MGSLGLQKHPLRAALQFLHRGQVYIVHPLSRELPVTPEPREPLLLAEGLPAAVLAPVDVRLGAQYTGALPAAGEVGGQEGAEVEAHAVVGVRLPADGLRFDGLRLR